MCIHVHEYTQTLGSSIFYLFFLLTFPFFVTGIDDNHRDTSLLPSSTLNSTEPCASLFPNENYIYSGLQFVIAFLPSVAGLNHELEIQGQTFFSHVPLAEKQRQLHHVPVKLEHRIYPSNYFLLVHFYSKQTQNYSILPPLTQKKNNFLALMR